jgi:hypothetical protein
MIIVIIIMIINNVDDNYKNMTFKMTNSIVYKMKCLKND